MNELETLKKLLKLMKSDSLPKELLKKKDLLHVSIEDIVLAFSDERVEEGGILLVGFVCDNLEDSVDISYEPFDEVVKYLEK